MSKPKSNQIKLSKVVKVLFGSIRENKKMSIFAILLIAGESILECVLPFVMAKLINLMTEPDPTTILKEVLIYSAILIVIAMGSFTCGTLAAKCSAKAAVGFGKNLREDLFKKTTTFSFNNIDKFSVSSLVTRQNTDVWFIQMSYMMLIRAALRAPLMLIFSIIMCMISAFEMSWIFAITIPLLILGLSVIMITAFPIFNRLFKRYDKLNESVEENVRGMRVVKTYVREDYEKAKFKRDSENLRKGFTKAERLVALNNPLMSFAMNLTMFLVCFFGSRVIIKNGFLDANGNIIYGSFKVGDFSSLLTYGAQVLGSLMMLSMILVMFLMSAASMRRCYEVLTEEPTIKNVENPVMTVNNGSISFKNVSFKYNEKAEKYALSDINLDIKEGETIGIVGGTGSSKSTLVNLISRFYDATKGSVEVGGIDVKNYDIRTLRENVSMVLQKNVLFSGTIKENLLWGNANATDEEIVEACKIAQADSFVQGFPKKYETFIQQGGTNVSGGQKQRLCIARAILKKPKILILDDSTSAVDTKTDRLIRDGLKNTLPNTTKIIIAQRLSSVENADRIIVMNDGMMDGIGTHEELLKSNAIYREIYEIQNRVGGVQ